jgi:hypothetical protein
MIGPLIVETDGRLEETEEVIGRLLRVGFGREENGYSGTHHGLAIAKVCVGAVCGHGAPRRNATLTLWGWYESASVPNV